MLHSDSRSCEDQVKLAFLKKLKIKMKRFSGLYSFAHGRGQGKGNCKCQPETPSCPPERIREWLLLCTIARREVSLEDFTKGSFWHITLKNILVKVEFVCKNVNKSFTVIYLRTSVICAYLDCFHLEGQMTRPQKCASEYFFTKEMFWSGPNLFFSGFIRKFKSLPE